MLILLADSLGIMSASDRLLSKPLLAAPRKLQMTNVDCSVTSQHVISLFQHFGLTVVSAERLYLPTTAADGASSLRQADRLPMALMVIEFGSAEEAAAGLRAMDCGTVNGMCVRLQPVL